VYARAETVATTGMSRASAAAQGVLVTRYAMYRSQPYGDGKKP